MSIISKETWDKFTQEEKESIRKTYQRLLGKEYSDIYTDEEMNGALSLANAIFPKEQLQLHPLTYEDVARELFMGRYCYYTDFGGLIKKTEADYKDYQSAGYCISVEQAEKLLAINRLLNVAKFLNKVWKPDWSNNEDKWSLCVDPDINKVKTIKVYHSEVNRYIVYFRTEELAKQAIKILGEDTVRLALTTEY